MLEACVDKRTGEIIMAKPLASLWSDQERDGRVLVVILLDDDTLEVPDKGLAYPYSKFGPLKNVLGEKFRERVEISHLKVEPASLSPQGVVRRSQLKTTVQQATGLGG